MSETKEKEKENLEETEVYPVNPKTETIRFPWAIAIIIGVLMALIIACLVIILVLEH